MHLSKCLLQVFQGAMRRSFSRVGTKMTATQLVNDILHGMYDKAFLANHTLAGGNSAKEALDAEVVQAISGKFLSFFDCGIKMTCQSCNCFIILCQHYGGNCSNFSACLHY